MMIDYEIIHHVPGRIRLNVPLIKKIGLDGIKGAPEDLKKFTFIAQPEAITSIQPNPVTGSLVIYYERHKIDILGFIDDLLAGMEESEEIRSYIKRMSNK